MHACMPTVLPGMLPARDENAIVKWMQLACLSPRVIFYKLQHDIIHVTNGDG